ncbi:unannotated protein [freshwater metagenome]|uniref:Unannotated protein n=1 Tax=freshwater metagenome TaxID=449393 RepID=A0A6J7M5U5_9ZZZZ|nr:DUF3043 domain-containing protein [Actinomycetota bacterium]MSX49564.1 DUF3043 domain-containing protein [Actinomycetota bacterium]
MTKSKSSPDNKKGKPTPKRKVAEAKSKSSILSPATSRSDKKRLKEQTRLRRTEARAAFMRGDENALPYRDKGAARRFVRNYVDSRRSIAEYFLVLIIFVLFLTIIPNPTIQLFAIAIMYSAMLYAAIDGFLLSRRVKRLVIAKFPNESARGVGMYAWLRSTQMRRLRAPAPQVKIGANVN